MHLSQLKSKIFGNERVDKNMKMFSSSKNTSYLSLNVIKDLSII